MKNTIISTVFFLFLSVSAIAQKNEKEEKATQDVYEAMSLMDNGFFDKSIELMQESIKIIPDNMFFQYELGLAYYKKGDYKEALKIYKKLIKHKDVDDLTYQMLGNTYDLLGERKNAIKAYEQGLEKFPNSGKLHLERSVIHMMENEYEEAIVMLERGVSAEPMFPSNYYWLAKIFLTGTDEEVWGMIYGELFRYLEPQTARSEEISKLLYNIYKNEIRIEGDSISVSFSRTQNININISESSLDDPSNLLNALQNARKISFGVGVYEPTLLLSLIGIDEINLKTLNDVRSRFVDRYFDEHDNKDDPNILFDFQKKIKDAGHMEAYNYWLLMYGNEDEFDEWLSHKENVNKSNDYLEWYRENKGLFEITLENKFLRVQ